MYGDSFATFYRASQIRIFSALDNALSQKAEETLTEFAAVKNAEVNFQTSLGNRQGQLGINLIGAFAESQNHGIGWQVRVYGGEKSSKGANAGIFYRRFNGDILFGGNAFVDYENHKLGNFSRYSIGGEVQNRYGSFAANYYVPITKEKRKDGGVIFSRKGYDAKLRLDIPNAKFIKAAVDYYNFGNENGSESDNGLRYGAELQPTPALRIGIFYDDGEEELGGEVSYTHTIGEVQQAQTTNEQWTPDLFAAVSREHSQRIVSVNVDNSPSFSYRSVNLVRPTTATIGTVNIPAGYAPPSASLSVSIPANTGFSVAANGGIVIATIAANATIGMTAATISINANVATYATAFIISLNVSRASSPPSFQSALGTVEVGASATVGILNIPRGFFDNTPAINPLSPGLTANGNTLIWQPTTRGLQNLSVEVSGAPSSQNATLTIAAAGYERLASVQATLHLDFGGVDAVVVSTQIGFFITLPPPGANPPFVVTVSEGAMPRTAVVLSVIRSNLLMIGHTTSFRAIDMRLQSSYTITIVVGSEENEMTLYAQAVMPFDMPGFSPPPFPQVPKLAFADPVILVRWAGIQTFSRHSRAGGNQLAAGRRMLMAQSAI